MKRLSQWILKTAGWTLNAPLEEPAKSVLVVAPHTSNWDFIMGKLSYWAWGRESSFLMKKSWFFFPVGNLLRAMGGIAVDRGRRTSITDQVAEEFGKREFFHVAITPEGTRKRVKKWKMGFYQIAVKAGVPIELVYFDYSKKEVGITKIIIPSGNVDADLKEIRDYYRNVKGRFPENFDPGA